MQQYSPDIVVAFVRKYSRNDKAEPNSDIFGELGIVGDDFHELIEQYAKQFHVDMTGYLWYFHADGEGLNFDGKFLERRTNGL